MCVKLLVTFMEEHGAIVSLHRDGAKTVDMNVALEGKGCLDHEQQ